MSGVIQMPCLGRPFRMGMLYDCRNHQLKPGLNLWAAPKGDPSPQPSGTYHIIKEDTLHSKLIELGVEAGLKLSLLSGLVSAGGSARYLFDRKSSKHHIRLSSKFQSTTAFEQLQLQKIENPDILQKNLATHVVTGVLYGADGFFVFDVDVSKSTNKHDLEGKMQLMIAAIPNIDLGIEGSGGIKLKSEHKEVAEKMQCKFFGDFNLPHNPSTFEEAVKIYKELPELLDKHAVPKIVWLTPLHELTQVNPQIVRDVNIGLITVAEKLLENIDELTIWSMDICKGDVLEKFPYLKKQLTTFQDLVDGYQKEIKRKLMDLVPKIRGGDAEEEELRRLFDDDEQCPFDFDKLSEWLQRKENEMKTLTAILGNIDSTVQFVATSDPGISLNVQQTVTICLGFNVVKQSSPFLEGLEAYLRNQPASSDPLPAPWFGKDTIKVLRNRLEHFKKLTDAYKKSSQTETLKIVATNRINEIKQDEPEICLYQGGETYVYRSCIPDLKSRSNIIICLEYMCKPQYWLSAEKEWVKHIPKSAIAPAYQASVKWLISDAGDDSGAVFLESMEYRNHYLTANDKGWCTIAATTNPNKKKWKFEEDGAGNYYLQYLQEPNVYLGGKSSFGTLYACVSSKSESDILSYQLRAVVWVPVTPSTEDEH